MHRVIKSLAMESISQTPKLTLIIDHNGFATLKKGLESEPGFLLKETRSSITIELTAYYPMRATIELQKKDFIDTTKYLITEH
jgi:hypothetical protein